MFNNEQVTALLSSPDISPLLERVVPVFTEMIFDQCAQYNRAIGQPDYCPFLYVILDGQGQVCDGLLKLESVDGIIDWFDRTELRYVLERSLPLYPRNEALKSIYFDLVDNMCFSCFFLKLEKLDWLVSLDPDPQSACTQRAYEQKILYFDRIAELDLKKPYDEFLRSIEDQYLQVFELYLPTNSFRYALEGYKAYEHLIEYYVHTGRSEKALALFDQMRNNSFLYTCQRQNFIKFDLYDLALRLISESDGEVGLDRIRSYYAELQTQDHEGMSSRDRFHYYQTLYKYVVLLWEKQRHSDPDQATMLIRDWYDRVGAAVKQWPHEYELKGLFMQKMLDLALNHDLLVNEALDASENLAEVYDHYQPYMDLVMSRIEVLARERDVEHARDFMITTLSDQRIFNDFGLSVSAEYVKAVQLLIDWQLFDPSSLAFVEMIAEKLPMERTASLLAEFRAALDK
ncbi:hypothetical protein JXQ70_03305 [bacterium]|nr:hypothetical protein [bacterium]